MAGLLTGPASGSLQRLFIPGVSLLIFFLGYTSQWLFNTAEYLEPGPLTERQTTVFNILLVCVWWTYYKACTVSPGRYNFPPASNQSEHDGRNETAASSDQRESETPFNQYPSPTPTAALPIRWCKKCAAPKPPRAHHCRHCGTCIPKMDHHCPWTANCVSLQTFPYFLRFLLYTNLALAYLTMGLLYPRLRSVFWDNSALPAYLGPSVPAMAHLVLLTIIGGLTSLALTILLVTTVRGWVLNQTMIEGWEQERHEAVLLRHKKGGWWDGGDTEFRIQRIEFPYDVGFFTNMAQAMGTRNILSWFDPIVGRGPVVSKETGKGTGWAYEENGFNDREGMWPPPDPDKTRRGAKWPGAADALEAEKVDDKWQDPREQMAAFRARQDMDLRRRTGQSGVIAELGADEELADLEYDYVDGDSTSGYSDEESSSGELEGRGRAVFEQGVDGEPGWTNSEGDRLRDFGVDEDAEDDDEDVPLGELLRRRRAYAQHAVA